MLTSDTPACVPPRRPNPAAATRNRARQSRAAAAQAVARSGAAHAAYAA